MAVEINPAWKKTLIFSKYSRYKRYCCLNCVSDSLTTTEKNSKHHGDGHTVVTVFKYAEQNAFKIEDIERIGKEGFELDTVGIARYPANESKFYFVKSQIKHDKYKSNTSHNHCHTCGRLLDGGGFCSILCKLMHAGVDSEQRAAFVKELRLSENSEKEASKNMAEGSGIEKEPTNVGKKSLQDLREEDQLRQAKKLKVAGDGDGDGGGSNKGKKSAANAVLHESATMIDLNQVYVPEFEISSLETAEAEKETTILMELEKKSKSGDDVENKRE